MGVGCALLTYTVTNTTLNPLVHASHVASSCPTKTLQVCRGVLSSSTANRGPYNIRKSLTANT